jgi:hypothetical protein
VSATELLVVQALATAFVYAAMIVGEALDTLMDDCEDLADLCHAAEASHG